MWWLPVYTRSIFLHESRICEDGCYRKLRVPPRVSDPELYRICLIVANCSLNALDVIAGFIKC